MPPTTTSPDLEIRHLPDRGRAVFAARHFAKGDLVDTAPVILGDTHWNDLPAWIGRYVYAWQDIGGTGAVSALALGLGSLYNASTTANLTFRAAQSNDAIEYHAARDIAPGEELTINYSSDDGSPTCDRNTWFEERDIPYLDG
jgi:hypothetical protein